MAVEIQKLEAVARITMGHFEGGARATPAKPGHRFPRPAYGAAALVFIGLAVTLL